MINLINKKEHNIVKILVKYNQDVNNKIKIHYFQLHKKMINRHKINHFL